MPTRAISVEELSTIVIPINNENIFNQVMEHARNLELPTLSSFINIVNRNTEKYGNGFAVRFDGTCKFDTLINYLTEHPEYKVLDVAGFLAIPVPEVDDEEDFEDDYNDEDDDNDDDDCDNDYDNCDKTTTFEIPNIPGFAFEGMYNGGDKMFITYSKNI